MAAIHKVAVLFLYVISLTLLANGECINACSGHGQCSLFDMCICDRNFMGADCSQRSCHFDFAYIDTPKGDLNSDGRISDLNEIVLVNSQQYPYGTTEEYPHMRNSDGEEITQAAHWYMECSNNGICNRTSGTCNCFPGFEGASCNRLQCPGDPVCSGHGLCRNLAQLAKDDYDNHYNLWDKHITRGCQCDKGYYGPDCSKVPCKMGIDPMYIDETQTIQYQAFDMVVFTTAPTATFNDGMLDSSPAFWKIRFFDQTGEDWLTVPLSPNVGCTEILNAINLLPNDVIKAEMGPELCTTMFRENVNVLDSASWTTTDNLYFSDNPEPIVLKFPIWDPENDHFLSMEDDHFSSGYNVSGSWYRLHFMHNPGLWPRQPEIEIYLDGKRQSMVSPGYKVITKVWVPGYQGEEHDEFADHCPDVDVSLGTNADGDTILTGLDTEEISRLRDCLGGSDFDDSNNNKTYVEDWEHGTLEYPHMIKLILSQTTLYDRGKMSLLIFDGVDFVLLNRHVPNALTDQFQVYTTKGVLQRITTETDVAYSFASKTLYMTNDANWYGDLSCEHEDQHSSHYSFCLNKGDTILIVATNTGSGADSGYAFNPVQFNWYTVQRMHEAQVTVGDNSETFYSENPGDSNEWFGSKPGTRSMAKTITVEPATNWAHSWSQPDNKQLIYKWTFEKYSRYTYVSECANRGLCNDQTGHCTCFRGYRGEACTIIDAYAI